MPGCGVATLNTGFSCIQLTPLAVNASGLPLAGTSINFITPRTLSSNLTFQYAVTHTISAQIAYVITDGMNLYTGTGNNNVHQILPIRRKYNKCRAVPGFRTWCELPANHWS